MAKTKGKKAAGAKKAPARKGGAAKAPAENVDAGENPQKYAGFRSSPSRLKVACAARSLFVSRPWGRSSRRPPNPLATQTA